MGFLAAFLAGLASFLAPCVLPLIPGYLSYMTGVSVEELATTGASGTRRVVWHAALFVLGFTLVFVTLGATATTLGRLLKAWLPWLQRIAGVLIILFGLHLTGLLRLRFLLGERRYQGAVSRGTFGTLLLGMAFAFGWTPCVGPVLFSILAYAGTQETVARGMLLLMVYSLGLGVPFLLAGVFFGTFVRFFDRFKVWLHRVEVASGVLLLIFGLLVLSGWMLRVQDVIQGWLRGGP